MKRIYLDFAASTPIDKKVSGAMQKALAEAWANPSSLHQEGERAKQILEESRAKIAAILRCRPAEIYFTSGGTEAANIAISGIVKNKKNPHIICSSLEHPAILESVKNSGANISFVSPNENGIVSPEKIQKEIKENTVLICLMHSNNEIGTIEPVKEVARRKSQSTSKPYLLVDASQSALYEDVSPERLGADILILDGIKMYGPRGAGILFVKHGVEITPTIFGGGQERGLRSGTENAISAAGLACALEIAVQKREKESIRLTLLRDYTIAKMRKEIPSSSLNGDSQKRLPNNINICFPGQDSEFLVIKLDTLGFSVSAASACNNLNLENSSYVIESLHKSSSTSPSILKSSGLKGSESSKCASSSLRITLGRSTTKPDLDQLISALKKIIKK